MSKLKWDQLGEKIYETGLDHGILFPQKDGSYPKGIAWSGLITVSESPSGAENNALYADNIKYLNLKSAEEYGGNIECYTYPDEWAQCNGESELADGVMLSQQRRNSFGLCYRTKVGNDTEGEDHGFKLHLIYGATASPSEKSHGTVNDSPEAITFSFEFSTTPVPVSGKDSTGKPFKPVSAITIDSTKADPEKLQALEEILYGTDDVAETGEDGTETTVPGKEARLPLPDEIRTIFAAG